MKATGIIRKIDDLGRIVIPKEIRRTMRIREGDPLEIYTNHDGEVIFKKYSLLEGIEDCAGDLCDALNRSTGGMCIVTDRDMVIAVAGGGKRDLLDRRISRELEQLLDRRTTYRCDAGTASVPVTDSTDKYTVLAASPVLSEGDLVGSVLLADTEQVPAQEVDCKLIETFAAFLGRHLAE